MAARPDHVFLNLPFDARYERLLVAQIAALISLGRTPRCVLEIPEVGQGRFVRLVEIIGECGVSVHDLSRVGLPARFNMPFELGMACAVSVLDGPHEFILLESKRHRLDLTLSDVKGRDPYIHAETVTGMIGCVLDAFGSPGDAPDIAGIKRVDRKLWAFARARKQARRTATIFNRTVFQEVCMEAANLAHGEGLIA